MTEIKNIILTGAPSSGKTTVIKKILKSLNLPCNGFYTEEERTSDCKRIGFMMHTLDGKSGYLAHQDIPSDFHIRRYGVSLKNIDSLIIPSIKPIGSNIIILDEIGKMECFSPAFIRAAKQALDSPNLVVGTITLGGEGFIQEVKNREDIEIIEVTPENRNELPQKMIEHIKTFFRTV